MLKSRIEIYAINVSIQGKKTDDKEVILRVEKWQGYRYREIVYLKKC